MLWFKRLLAIALISLVSACSEISMQPLASANLGEMAQISVKGTSGRDGQLYTRELRKRLRANAVQNPAYDLISTISVSSSSTLSVKGKSSTLKKMTMSVDITLLDKNSGDIVLSETLSAGATLGVVSSYYGQDEAERNGRERLAKLLAERAGRRVLLFFSAQQS